MFFFSSRRRHTSWPRDWSSDVCSSDLAARGRRALPAGPDPVPPGPAAALGHGAPGGWGLITPDRGPGPRGCSGRRRGGDRHPPRRRRHGDHPAARRRTMNELTHVRSDGSAHMVDVTDKTTTSREATARAILRTRPEVVARLAEGDLPKGEALAVASVAGIMAAKRTSDLIPPGHAPPLSGVELDLVPRDDHVEITARVRTRGVTGVEMEALTAASAAALTVYDMIKAVDHLASIETVQVLSKSGGKSGDWHRESDAPAATGAGDPSAVEEAP